MFRNTYSSLAQSVEHAAVNRRVVGSSPTGGAIRNLVLTNEVFLSIIHLKVGDENAKSYI